MIVCIGEALVDIKDGRKVPGGGPFNVSVACSRLGAAVTYIGDISSDEGGKAILDRLVESKVLFEPDLCGSALPTMEARPVEDADGNVRYTFTEGPTTAVSITTDRIGKAVEGITDADCFVTGTLALADPKCRNEIASFLKGRKDCSWLVVDANVRPAFISDMDKYRNFIEDFAGCCDIVKASDEDLSHLYPGLSVEEASARLLAHCRRHLIVTYGTDGSCWFDKGNPDEAVFCPAVLAEHFVDTVGCGDVYLGAVLACLQANGHLGRRNEGKELELERVDKALAMDFASNAACCNASVEGCDPPTIDILC